MLLYMCLTALLFYLHPNSLTRLTYMCVCVCVCVSSGRAERLHEEVLRGRGAREAEHRGRERRHQADLADQPGGE